MAATLTPRVSDPDERALGADWQRELGTMRFGANPRGPHYGKALPAGTATAQDRVLDAPRGDDRGLRAKMSYVTVTLGADDLFDQYLTEVPAALKTTGRGAFSSFSPFGFDGRFPYARASVNW